jgi:hypothetical protein
MVEEHQAEVVAVEIGINKQTMLNPQLMPRKNQKRKKMSASMYPTSYHYGQI